MEDADEEQETTQPQPELVACGVCNTGAAKYKCPRCFVQTCSLPCVRKHKEDAKCRYIRDVCARVPFAPSVSEYCAQNGGGREFTTGY